MFPVTIKFENENITQTLNRYNFQSNQFLLIWFAYASYNI